MAKNVDTTWTQSQIKLIEAAGSLFAQKGFAATSVRDICKKAKINISSINYHFGGKEQIYIACFKYSFEQNNKLYPQPQFSADEPAEEVIFKYIKHRLLRNLGSKNAKWHTKILKQEVFSPTGLLKDFVKDRLDQDTLPLMDAVKQIIDEDCDIATLKRCLISVIAEFSFYVSNDIFVETFFPEQKFDEKGIEELAKHITRIMIIGIRENYGLLRKKKKSA